MGIPGDDVNVDVDVEVDVDGRLLLDAPDVVGLVVGKADADNGTEGMCDVDVCVDVVDVLAVESVRGRWVVRVRLI